MGSSGEEEGNFRFNDIDFSDMVLRLEITPAMPSNTSEYVATDLKLKKIHINSLLLAYKSPFFFKLFKNGMKETQQKDEVALKINEFEETAFMDLLKFIYDQSMDASSGPDLIGVLMAADKFEVPSCVKYCVDFLIKFPMSTELALVYLELPSSLLANEGVHTLFESGRGYICSHYSDFTKSQEEVMKFPLCALEIFIASNGLQVDSEDDVFDFMLKWGRLHYPELEERREILTRLLVNFIFLPNMSSLKLKEVLDFSDFDSERVWKPVMDALFSKFQELPATKYDNPRRVYNHKFFKMVQLQLARPRCVVYFDLTKKECAYLVPHKRLYTQTFFLGGEKIVLFARCKLEPHALGLYMHVMEGSETVTLDLDFSVMMKSSKEFTSLHNSKNLIFTTNNRVWGKEDLFRKPWKELMSDESEYFIDKIAHLRVDLTLVS